MHGTRAREGADRETTACRTCLHRSLSRLFFYAAPVTGLSSPSYTGPVSYCPHLLDRFKTINDNLGHANGDLLLKDIGERLAICVREEDTVARLGGDEFIVLLPEIRYIQDAATVAQKILDRLARPFNLDGHEIFIGTSIGIAFYPFEDHLDVLLHNADIAMYHAKAQGGNSYLFFSMEMNTPGPKRPTPDTA